MAERTVAQGRAFPFDAKRQMGRLLKESEHVPTASRPTLVLKVSWGVWCPGLPRARADTIAFACQSPEAWRILPSLSLPNGLRYHY